MNTYDPCRAGEFTPFEYGALDELIENADDILVALLSLMDEMDDDEAFEHEIQCCGECNGLSLLGE